MIHTCLPRVLMLKYFSDEASDIPISEFIIVFPRLEIDVQVIQW